MRGIVLAGGAGSRLGMTTKVVNKHLLPVGDTPMICWAIGVLRINDIEDITVVSTPRGVGNLAELIGGGCDYRVQDQPGGIAHAIKAAGARYNDNRHIVVILGDNLFLPVPKLDFRPAHCSACTFLKEMPEDRLKEFGVAQLHQYGNPKIVEIHEKPDNPPSRMVATGLYVFDANVFDKIDQLENSNRGELEVSDLLNLYAKEARLEYKIVNGFWGDAGTLQGLAECNEAAHHWTTLSKKN